MRRRLIAILFADIVGYGELCRRDEAGTRAEFKRRLRVSIRPTILRCKGRLIEEVGDSLLAEFEPQKYHDAYRENLMAMIQAKVEGKQIVETVETKHKAPVVDILEALKMSLAEVKKPIRSSTGTVAVPVEEDRPAKKSRKTGG